MENKIDQFISLSENYLKQKNEITDLPPRALKKLRSELINLIAKISSTLAELPKSVGKEKKKLLLNCLEEIDELELVVSKLVLDRKKEKALHQYWEETLIPETNQVGEYVPRFTNLPDFKVTNLLSFMDESWLPRELNNGSKPLQMGAS